MFEDLFSRYNSISFFDTETTGLRAEPERDGRRCQIIELAICTITPNGHMNEYDQFVKLPEGQTIPEKIKEITGITDAQLATGVTEESAAETLLKIMSQPGHLMVAHNCQFDLCFVREAMRNVFGAGVADEMVSSVDWLDSLTVFKDRKSFPHKLCDAIEYYNLGDKVVNSHRAIDDVKALVAVCEAMDTERADLDKYINVFGYNPKYGVNGSRVDKIRYVSQPYTNGMTPDNRILPNR